MWILIRVEKWLPFGWLVILIGGGDDLLLVLS